MITIIVLLILAGVTLAMLAGDSSIFTRANEAVKATEFATVREELEVAYNSAYAENMAKVHVDREPTDLKTAISEAMEPILQKYAQENANKKAAIIVEPTENLTFDASGKATIKLTYKADGSNQTGTITVSDVISASDSSLKAEQATFTWGAVTGEADGKDDLEYLRSELIGSTYSDIDWSLLEYTKSLSENKGCYLYNGKEYCLCWGGSPYSVVDVLGYDENNVGTFTVLGWTLSYNKSFVTTFEELVNGEDYSLTSESIHSGREFVGVSIQWINSLVSCDYTVVSSRKSRTVRSFSYRVTRRIELLLMKT